MKKIGFIDYYLDEWHANNYPEWIKEASNGEMEVAYAYGHIDSPIGGITTDAWCEKYGIKRCRTMEELVMLSDYLIVLSPDNCEMHEVLSREALRSGKPTYIDKTFSPDLAMGKRIFALAEEYHTPCYSSSALRFADEYQNVDKGAISAMFLWGPNDLETYSIHQWEPLMMLMNTPAKRVLCSCGETCTNVSVEFTDGRIGGITLLGQGGSFVSSICFRDGNKTFNVESQYFQSFIRELVDFFKTGKEKVDHRVTLQIMAAREAGIKAAKQPGKWIEVEEI